jgi:predicted AAA+ superfamily ATPase
MVIGARQVGKTYIIEEFCEKEFPRSLVFNLFDRADIVSMFSEPVNTEEKIKKLELLTGEKIDFENTILFFDEVQQSEELVAALKYFAESETNFKIICAGSLLGVKIRRFSMPFPVGKVEMLHMGPMDMEEVLLANGEALLIQEIKDCYKNNQNIAKALHEKCLNYYRAYLCSGGMPEAVWNMTENGNDVLLFDSSILSNIRDSYLSDMNKYVAGAAESTKIEAVYRSIPAQLGNKANKFQYSEVKRGARGRDFSSAIDWLASSGMVCICTKVSAPNMPLKGFEEDGFFKVFLNDAGILCSLLGVRLSEIMLDADFHYKGVIVENYVACQFAASGIPLHYWKSKNTSEVDFLIDTAEGIVPVEVKSGKNKASASLELYRERFRPPFAIKIRTGNFGFSAGIKSVPLYAAFCVQPD